MAKESVWNYPRPPRLEPANRTIRVVHRGVVIAETSRALRMLETSHPPTYYIPVEDIQMGLLVPNQDHTVCEWKGMADYFDLVMGNAVVPDAAWTYPNPNSRYSEIVDHLAFYARKMDACYVDDEKVDAQAGSFYGGWITSDIEGPFKGSPGTGGW